GIRDGHVTGVQTCALPISGFLVERPVVLLVWLVGLLLVATLLAWVSRSAIRRADTSVSLWLLILAAVALASPLLLTLQQHPSPRSEERRVGKERMSKTSRC